MGGDHMAGAWRVLGGQAYTFTHAITRLPAATVAAGLRAIDTGAPDPALFRIQHGQYVEALREAGVEVVVLDPLDDFPDSVFVEDTALCLPEGAVVLRPGAPSRLGEVAAILPALRARFAEVPAIHGPGHVEGGDILVTGREIIVGLSNRTDAEGVAELGRLVSAWDYRLRTVVTPREVLHFKTDCSLLDEETVLATPRLAAQDFFHGYRVVRTAPGEEAAANTVRVNGHVILPAGYPRTASHLASFGYDVRELANSEAARLDGGMSCLSLRLAR